MTIVNLTPVLQPLIDTAGYVLAAAALPIAALLIRLLHLQGNAIASGLIRAATEDAAGIAYTELAAASHHPASIEIRDSALAAGVQHVLDAAPAAVARSGLTKEMVAQQVSGQLGKMLARDPTVPAGPSATAGA